MSMGMSGNGQRIAGMKRTPVTQEMAPRGQREIADFGFSAAVRVTTLLTLFVRPDERRTQAAIVILASAFELPEHCNPGSACVTSWGQRHCSTDDDCRTAMYVSRPGQLRV